MSLLTSIHAAHSGLKSASLAIETTAHNVANVATKGFHRRSVERSVADPVNAKGVSLGQGVRVLRVRRATDDLLGVQMVEQRGVSSKSKNTYTALQGIETTFNESNSVGFIQSLDEFFDALGRATSDPSDSGLRMATVRKAETFASTVNRTADTLGQSIDDLASDVAETMEKVNDIAAELLEVNNSLVSSQDTVGAGDLLDKRDMLVNQLAELIGSTVDYESVNQTATVFVGGHALVSGISSRLLFQGVDSTGEPTVEMATDSGSVVVTEGTSGRMGGLEQARTHMKSYLDQLDIFATGVAEALNTQHQLGFDRSGTGGQQLFSFATASAGSSLNVNSSILDDPNLIAFSDSAAGGAGNDGNLESLQEIKDQDLFNAGTSTSLEFGSDLMSEVGNDISKYGGMSASEEQHLNDLEGTMDALTGVSLDQEATTLIEFQAAYQASAKVIQVADSLLRYLLDTI